MEKTVLKYGSFVSGKKITQIQELDTVEEIPQNENIEEVSVIQEAENQPVETDPKAELQKLESYPVFEIPTIEEIVNPKISESAEKEVSEVTESTEQSQDFYLTSTKNDVSSEELYDWEIPYYNDSLSKQKKTKTVRVRRLSPVQIPEKTAASQVPADQTDAENPVEAAEENQKTKVKTSRKEKKSKSEKKNSKHAENTKFKGKVKRPIGVVLIGIISAIVILSIAAITVVVTTTTTKDTIVKAQETNRSQCSSVAKDCESRFNSVVSSAELLYALVQTVNNDDEELLKTADRFFDGNAEIAAVAFLDSDKTYINRKFFSSHDIEPSLVQSYLISEEEMTDAIVPGKMEVENATPFFGTSLAALFSSVAAASSTERALVLFSTESVHETISANQIYLSYIVNRRGNVIVHPDISVMRSNENFSAHRLVSEMNEGQNNKQITYSEGNSKEKIIGCYYTMNSGSCAAITEVYTSIILEGVNATIRRNIYLTVAILALSVMAIWLFSSTLSTPLKTLTDVTNEIRKGNFDTEKFDELQENRKDEIGVLIESTKAERAMLNTVTKLTNPDVTRAVARNEIDMNPHLKDITIFFSDIRNFTSISDSFNNQYGKESASQIIGFLNDYMGRMVNCIAITGGSVDKFEGDAIMAAWGTLRNDSLDFEQLPKEDPVRIQQEKEHKEHVEEDAHAAIKTAVAMRYALMEYNKAAKSLENKDSKVYKPSIRIGAGINTGRATVGFMGSETYKLEHTCIGDAVNLASRTESSTKPCCTDILITQDTYDLLKTKYIRCPENNFNIASEYKEDEIIVEQIPVDFEVKGKGKQHFYGVVNMPAFDIEKFFKAENTNFANPDFKVDYDCLRAVGPDGPKSLNDVRDLLGIPVPDFSGVNLNEEEKKVQIQ